MRAALLVLAALCACAPALPADRSAAALYRDLQRLVTLTETRGWEIDRIEVEDLIGDALQSLCRTTPESRAALGDWLDARVQELGGPVEQAYQRRGRDLSAVAELLEVTRIRLVYAAAVTAAPADCPFWLAPERPFHGRQVADDRFQLLLEGGGKVIGLRAGGENDLAGGGAGRLLVGRNFGTRLGLFTGIEVGGSAEFRRDVAGERGLVLALDMVFPAAVRYRFVNAYLELETGPLVHFSEAVATSGGLHVGAAVGVKTTRTRFIIPGIALAASYDRTFGESDTHFLKLGLRITFDLDL